MNMTRTTLTGVLAAFGLIASTALAAATPAASTTALNVRSGPGPTFGVVDTLTPGENVDVTECVSNGWCYINHPGPDGWVSSNYLNAGGGGSGGSGGGSGGSSGGSSADPDCGFGITIGPSGPTFSINCGDTPPPPPAPPAPPAPPPPAPAANIACFYTGNNFTGSEFCTGPAQLNALSGTFNDNIASVKVSGNAKAKLCRNNNLAGACHVYTSDRAVIHNIVRNKASSLAVFTGATPGPIIVPIPIPPLVPLTAVTYSTGPINLKPTWNANLDNGNVGNAGADIWYQVASPIQKFITPRNGAKLALGNKSNRGYFGCKAESFSSQKISIWQIPVGSYVCVKTNQGRISQFRLNGYTGTTMKLGYTTWKN